jgi:hypothetical protein
MSVPGHAGYGEFPSSSNIHELYRHLHYFYGTISCLHASQHRLHALWRAIRIDLTDFFLNKKLFFIVYMFVHGFQVKENIFPFFSSGNIFFRFFRKIFQSKLAARGHMTAPLKKNFQNFFSHTG